MVLLCRYFEVLPTATSSVLVVNVVSRLPVNVQRQVAEGSSMRRSQSTSN
ncbi:MAG: hypothetical protein HWQ23_20330 [Nostoc sp. JL33]|nr:hypothetical protein [Nostoc sp. JL33]MBN3872538.1 hypothetical protein [Nostoc sp. JL33]